MMNFFVTPSYGSVGIENLIDFLFSHVNLGSKNSLTCARMMPPDFRPKFVELIQHNRATWRAQVNGNYSGFAILG